jgi:hypothetical protein
MLGRSSIKPKAVTITATSKDTLTAFLDQNAL